MNIPTLNTYIITLTILDYNINLRFKIFPTWQAKDLATPRKS